MTVPTKEEYLETVKKIEEWELYQVVLERSDLHSYGGEEVVLGVFQDKEDAQKYLKDFSQKNMENLNMHHLYVEDFCIEKMELCLDFFEKEE